MFKIRVQGFTGGQNNDASTSILDYVILQYF